MAEKNPDKKKTTPAKNVVQLVASLRQQINHDNHQYHTLDQPGISDAEFDRLFRDLKALEQEHPDLVSDDSPTQRVGATPLSEFGSITHRIPMLSLSNAMDADEIEQFHEQTQKGLGVKKINYVAEPKLDGLAVELVYEKGVFISGSTR